MPRNLAKNSELLLVGRITVISDRRGFLPFLPRDNLREVCHATSLHSDLLLVGGLKVSFLIGPERFSS